MNFKDGFFSDDNENDTPIETINSFTGEYAFLGNFYDCVQNSEIAYMGEDGDVKFVREDFRTVEHAFQASKTLNREEQLEIINATSPKAAKRLGRRCTLRQDWDGKRVQIMERLVRDKFSQHFDLKMKLLLLENKEIVEGNAHGDQFWGKTHDGVGENNLGKILMKIRNFTIEIDGTFKEHIDSFLRENQLGFVSDLIEWKI